MATRDEKEAITESNFLSGSIKVGPTSGEDIFPDNHEDTQNHDDYSGTGEAIQARLEKMDAHLSDIERQANEKLADTTLKVETLEKETRDKIEDSKSRVVETLALFAALFTFLSLQVQIFKDEKNINSITGLVFITAGVLTFFILILDLMIKTKKDGSDFFLLRFILLFVMCVALMGGGVAIIKFGNL